MAGSSWASSLFTDGTAVDKAEVQLAVAFCKALEAARLPSTMADKTVYEWVVLHVKPKYMLDMLYEIDGAKKVWEKYGAKQHGMWMSEAGTACVFYGLLEWRNEFDSLYKIKTNGLAKRSALKQTALKDPEYLAFVQKTNRCLLKAEDFLCKSEIPVKPFGAKQTIWIDIIKPRKFDQATVSKFVEEMGKYTTEFDWDATFSAFMNPFVYPERLMYAIWELKEGADLDNITTIMLAAKKDPKNWRKLEECQEYYEAVGSVIASPVDTSILPPRP